MNEVTITDNYYQTTCFSDDTFHEFGSRSRVHEASDEISTDWNYKNVVQSLKACEKKNDSSFEAEI